MSLEKKKEDWRLLIKSTFFDKGISNDKNYYKPSDVIELCVDSFGAGYEEGLASKKRGKPDEG
jgi:hypothetical protein